MLFSYFLITIISFLIAIPLFSLTIEELNELLATGLQNADISLLKYLQVSQTIGLFIIPALLLNYLVFYPDERFINEGVKNPPLAYILLFFSLVVSIPMISRFIEWNNTIGLPDQMSHLEELLKQMEGERNELTIRMLAGGKLTDLVLNLFIIAVLPAIGEEFIFRGVLQQLLAKWIKNIHIAIFIAAFLFSAIHLQFYGFVPRLLLGAFFGYLLFWSKNIWWAVWAHFSNNAIAIILIFLDSSGRISVPEIFKEEHRVNSLEFGVSIGLTLLILIFIYRISRSNIQVQKIE